jgi:hypothetical protein
MSTKRNYDRRKPSFNQIVRCYEYKRESEDPWNKKYVEEKRELTRAKELDDLIHFIPKDVRWKIEEDINDGAFALASFFHRTVIVGYESINNDKLSKEALDICGPGGYFELIRYARGLPDELVFDPSEGENLTDKDGIKIRLTIRPNKDHYIHTAEMRTDKINDYCLPCMLHSTSKAATIGTGDKSSRKTKGRYKRERAQLFYATGGIDL